MSLIWMVSWTNFSVKNLAEKLPISFLNALFGIHLKLIMILSTKKSKYTRLANGLKRVSFQALRSNAYQLFTWLF